MQNELKHTLLPWGIKSDSIQGISRVFAQSLDANDGMDIADFYGPDREANAALFMAAPDLKAENERLKAALQIVHDRFALPFRQYVDKYEGEAPNLLEVTKQALNL